MTVKIDRIVSHRFRGFAPQENSLHGCNAALSYGVKHVEFDIRVAACGTPMIFHDEHAIAGDGKNYKLCDVKASDYATLGGEFATFPTFEQLLEVIANHPKKDAQLQIDIKDAGFEEAIIALVHLYRLQDRVMYVSWVPEALYAINDLNPDAPLCLSHWCQSPDKATRAIHAVYDAPDGLVPRSGRALIHGERSGWFVNGGVKGEMRDMLVATGGAVCVPVNMVSKELVSYYHRHGISVAVFSYIDLEHAKRDREAKGIDYVFSDSKAVFDAL